MTARAIYGHKAVVTRNGEPVRATSAKLRRNRGKAGIEWEVHLAEPMNLAATDTWTIMRSFAGVEWTPVDEATPWSRSGETGEQSSRTVSGFAQDSESDLLKQYCVPKTIVFFNPDWLKGIDATAQVIDGIIKSKPLFGTATRLMNDRLPAKEVLDTQFTCIPATTHAEIASLLARQIGFSFSSNCPTVQLLDTFTVPSGTTWEAAIHMNFDQLWQPVWEAEGTKIYALDYVREAAAIGGLQKIAIDNPAIVGVSDRVSSGKDNIIDHVIIIGRKSKDSVGIPTEEPDFTPITIPEVSVSIDKVITSSTDLAGIVDQIQMSDQTPDTYGDPDDPITPHHGKRVDVVLSLHKIANPVRGDKYIPVQEEHKTYDASDTLIGKTVVEHKFSADFKPVRTIESQYAQTKMPGNPSPELTLMSVKTTKQNKFVKPLNLTLTAQMTEKRILYETATKAGVDFKDNLIPMDDLLRVDFMRDAIETDSNTKQDTLTMPAHFKQTFISRTDDNLLLKRDLDYTVLGSHVKLTSEILENPVRMISIQVKDAVFRREYYRLANSSQSTTDPNVGCGRLIGGTKCYHAPKTINHQDISTDELAEEVAERQFARSGDLDSNVEYVIKTPVPLILNSLMYLIELPDYTQTVNGVDVIVPGGDYVLKGWEENITWSGTGNIIECKPEQTLTVSEKP
jgi:hypothetical protein